MTFDSPPTIGVDLAGTKIEAIVLDHHGTSLWRERVATPAGDYMAALATMAALVARAERELGLAGCSVGIGTPGTQTPAGLIKNANSTCLNGQPLAHDLAQALGRPVQLANDANCLALSEATDGAGAGAGVVFAVILGTGVGAGVVVDGCVRDSAELAQCDIGIRALALVPMPTERRNQGQRDVALHLHGVWVLPGEWLVADEDGIVVMPKAPG